ncbi:hypothetical protein HanIR_Chr10g0462961 [Helianthus annuus]|nr:hypothetical protein HanIR_Chr10g0462961 [Helianthus annuus]
MRVEPTLLIHQPYNPSLGSRGPRRRSKGASRGASCPSTSLIKGAEGLILQTVQF